MEDRPKGRIEKGRDKGSESSLWDSRLENRDREKRRGQKSHGSGRNGRRNIYTNILLFLKHARLRGGCPKANFSLTRTAGREALSCLAGGKRKELRRQRVTRHCWSGIRFS